MTFVKAERKKVALKLALTGPSGSGKTFSALLLASGLGKKIAVIDTENGSASLYAGMKTGPLAGIEFDVLDLVPPYTIGKYTEGIKTAEEAGYEVLIIDSISHAWAGEGGLLQKKEALDMRGGRQNQYTNWAPITKEHEQFKARLLNCGIDLICTMRSKQDYVLEVDSNGKQKPRKVGLAPIQRDGMEYEFAVVFDLGMDHSAAASKDRTSLFDGMIASLTRETGRQLTTWRAEAKDAPSPKPAPARKPAAKPAPPAEPLAEPFPDEFAADDIPAPEPEVAAPATEDQQKAISEHIAELRTLGKDDGMIFSEIHRKAMEKGPEIAELSELTFAAADYVAVHLGAWIEHIKAARAKKGKAA